MNTLKECFDKILNGGREESRQAARKVRKLVYSSSASGMEKYEEIAILVRTASENYTRISEDWRQENFVMAISIYPLFTRQRKPARFSFFVAFSITATPKWLYTTRRG